MIKEERKSGNPLANLIHTVDLEKQTAALLLDAVDEDEDHVLTVDDKFIDNYDPVIKVDIDLKISCQLNVRKYFEIKKKSYVKEQKTKGATDQAIGAA